MAQDHTPLGKWSGSDATEQLEETIKRFQLENSQQQVENSQQQATMLWWTKACGIFVFLAVVVSLIALVVSLRR